MTDTTNNTSSTTNPVLTTTQIKSLTATQIPPLDQQPATPAIQSESESAANSESSSQTSLEAALSSISEKALPPANDGNANDETVDDEGGSQPSPEHRDMGGNVVAEQAALTVIEPVVADDSEDESEAEDAEDEYDENEDPRIKALYQFTDYWHPNVERTPTARWQAFCVGFPGMMAYLGSHPDFSLIPRNYQAQFDEQMQEATATKSRRKR